MKLCNFVAQWLHPSLVSSQEGSAVGTSVGHVSETSQGSKQGQKKHKPMKENGTSAILISVSIYLSMNILQFSLTLRYTAQRKVSIIKLNEEPQ